MNMIIADLISRIDWHLVVNLSTVGLFGLALIEYHKHRKDKRCEVLLKYHERYNTDQYITKVMHFYLKDSDVPPGVHDKEMFLRFFEEVELMLSKRYLRKKDVQQLFVFYFMVFWESDHFWEKLDKDKRDSNWSLGCKLYSRYEHEDTFMKNVSNERKQISLKITSKTL